MRAMILAAGAGTRLKPLTERTPKALVEVGGVPMLERVLRRLIAAGVDAAVVNVCHLADAVEGFLEEKRGFGIRVAVSREEKLLDTGGGLKKAAWFFDDGEPFFLHNADVMSDLDLSAMYRAHAASGDLATLAVSGRESDRRLLFDRDGLLRARGSGPGSLAFNGVHVVSPAIFPRMREEGAFSIMETYLRLAGEGERIRAFRMDAAYWRDIGSPEKLAAVGRELRERGLP